MKYLVILAILYSCTSNQKDVNLDQYQEQLDRFEEKTIGDLKNKKSDNDSCFQGTCSKKVQMVPLPRCAVEKRKLK